MTRILKDTMRRARVAKVTLALFVISLLGHISVYIIYVSAQHAPQYRKYLSKKRLHVNRTMPVLTLFTSFPQGGSKEGVWTATLKNWATLKPYVRPVYFYEDNSNISLFRQNGWDVLPITKQSPINIPILKDMFLDTMKTFDSPLYGFANGDILFDGGLLKTIQSVVEHLRENETPVLVTGRRTNVYNMTLVETSEIRHVTRAAKERGELFLYEAEDYFITDASYPWQEMPDLVIGKRGYDNFLVLRSPQLGVPVIDATETVLAVHQTTSDGSWENQLRPNVDYNMDLIAKVYGEVNFEDGMTVCASLKTKWGENKTVLISERYFRDPCLLRSIIPNFLWHLLGRYGYNVI